MKDYMQFSISVNLYSESKLQFVVLFECTFFLCRFCGHKWLSYLNLEQEWAPPSQCAQGLHISTAPQNHLQVILYFPLSQCLLLYNIPAKPFCPLHHTPLCLFIVLLFLPSFFTFLALCHLISLLSSNWYTNYQINFTPSSIMLHICTCGIMNACYCVWHILVHDIYVVSPVLLHWTPVLQ